MTTTFEDTVVTPIGDQRARVVHTATFNAQTDTTEWVLFAAGPVQFQVQGPVDAATVNLMRSTLDPSGNPNTTQVATATGNPNTIGVAGSFTGSAPAWYRLDNAATFGPASSPTARTLESLAAAVNDWQRDFYNIALSTPDVPAVTATYTATTLVLTAATAGAAGNAIATTETLTNGAWGGATLSGGVDAVAATRVGTFTAAGTANDTITINTTVYTLVAALTGVANQVLIGASLTATRNNLVGAIMLTGAASTNVLTASANPADGDTCRIGTKTYTFNTVLGGENSIFIGAAATNTLDNLIAAINSAAGVGTLYGAGTAPNADVSAAAGAGDTIDLTARYSGAASNLIPCTETSSALSFASSQMANGTGSGVTYNSNQVVHPTVSAVATSTNQITLTAKTVGTGGNAIATTESGTAFSWAGATLAGGVNAAFATGTLTMSGVFNNTGTVTINGVVYTFQTTLTQVAGNIMIAGTQAEVTLIGERSQNV